MYGFNDFIVSSGVLSYVIKNYFTNFDIHNNDFTVQTNNGKIKTTLFIESNYLRYWDRTVYSAQAGINYLIFY